MFSCESKLNFSTWAEQVDAFNATVLLNVNTLIKASKFEIWLDVLKLSKPINS